MHSSDTQRTRIPSSRPALARWLPCVLGVLGVLGCGGDDGSDEGTEARKPDTGYGKGEPPPSLRTCTDLCARLGDCAARLCNEDTNSTRYDALEDILTFQCEAMCSDSQLATAFTAAQWQCLYTNSCRQAIDYDDCHTRSTYSCN